MFCGSLRLWNSYREDHGARRWRYPRSDELFFRSLADFLVRLDQHPGPIRRPSEKYLTGKSTTSTSHCHSMDCERCERMREREKEKRTKTR